MLKTLLALRDVVAGVALLAVIALVWLLCQGRTDLGWTGAP